MSLTRKFGDISLYEHGVRSYSAQGMSGNVISSPVKIPLPPRLWITDVSNDSSEESGSGIRDESLKSAERSRVRSRVRHKHRSMVAVPLGIFWDIENCQVPRGCSALDVVSAIRSKFLVGRREADFVVVCDVRKESTWRLQELNDAQVSLIHVCASQKNAADDKLRQCMRRFGELHSAPASLLLISGDINFAGDLSDFRHRKNMEVLLVHKRNTSSALIACATSHYCFNELTASLPRNPKIMSQTSIEDEEATCEMEISNLPPDQPADRVTKRLRRLADNCGGKVLKLYSNTAVLRFPTVDHASRALKRMDGEDVFGHKIGTRYIRSAALPAMMHAYSSDEGYHTGTNQAPATPRVMTPPQAYSRPVNNGGQQSMQPVPPPEPAVSRPISGEWSLSLANLPPPPPVLFAPQPPVGMRKIRGTHGSNHEQSCSSVSGDESSGRLLVSNSAGNSRAVSPWNSSCFSEQSGDDDLADLTIGNLPPYGVNELHDILYKLFSQHVPVVRVSLWQTGEGPAAAVTVRGESEARLAIARLHKRRLGSPWSGRRLELSLGRPSPAPNLDVLRSRLRAILGEQMHHRMQLLPLKDAYASRYCSALTTSDLSKLKDTVKLHEGYGRIVELVDLRPVGLPREVEGPWRCNLHSTSYEHQTQILTHVYIDSRTLATHTRHLLDTHNGVLPLLSYVECYESAFPRLHEDVDHGVVLELLLRNIPGIVVKDAPTRHLTYGRNDTPSPVSSTNGSVDRDRPRTAPVLEPMLSFFERELVDLLKATKHCTLPFSKLIPAFHHHFGRQCRVADYGFTKLPDLLAALNKTIVVLGTGSSRIITLSAAAQKRRWTSDLLKILRTYSGRQVSKYELPLLYETVHDRQFIPSNYGVCNVHELLDMVTPNTVVFEDDGTIGLPRRAPTPAEKARTSEFAIEAIEILRQTPNLRIEFSRFVPSYHAHFGRQLRVAVFGCVKLAELIELVPDAVVIGPGRGNGADKDIRLAMQTARTVLLHRISMMTPVPLSSFANEYGMKFGAPPLPDMLGVETIEELVISAGAFINNGVVHVLAESQPNVNASLAAAAAITADRSITARGSSEEYFVKTFKELTGAEPDLLMLVYNGVITVCEGRVQLTPTWRAIYRVATIMSNRNVPLTVPEIYVEYTRKYEPDFPYAELGFSGLIEFLRHNHEVFAEDSTRRFRMRGGVSVLKSHSGDQSMNQDFSVYDTPPGQKGSRVFESPRINIWCSPPASALPSPSALLSQDARRRTRLAAQFNAAM